jgi:hypothetical protein
MKVPQRRKDKAEMAGNDLNKLVEQVISDYRLQNQHLQNLQNVQLMPHTSSGRTGAINIEATNETAEVLLHQLATLAKSGVEEPEQERLEMGQPPLLVVANRVRTFTTYFCGLKKDKPIWCYQEFLAARLNFAEAEKMAATLGVDVFALAANERRAVARQGSWRTRIERR